MSKLIGNRVEKRKDTIDTRSSIEQEYRSRYYSENLALYWTQLEASILKSDIEKENEKIIMQAQVEDLIKKYTNLKTGIKSTEWNRKTKNQLEKRLDQNLKNLNDIKNDLEWYTYDNSSTFKARIWELIYYFQHYEQVRQQIVLWWRTSDIHAIIDSEQDARRARSYEKSDAKYQERMNKILHDTAVTSLWNDDMERYEEYLESVVNWQVEPSSHPFYQAHRQSFRILEHTNPSLYKTLVPSWNWRTQYLAPTVWRVENWTVIISSWKKTTQSEAFPSRIWKGFWELLWNIFPTIENNPRQKQAWEQFGTVAALWWAIFMWYKVLKNIFSKKENNPNKWWKAAAWWVGLLALTNWDRIVKWWWQRMQDALNRHPAEKIQVSTELFKKYWFSDTEALNYSEMHVWAPVATMSALHFIPIYELRAQKIVEYKNNEFQFNYDKYKEYVNSYDRTEKQKEVVLAAWQKLRDDRSLSLWLAALGIHNEQELTNLTHWSKTKTLAECEEVQAWWENCVEWVSSWVHEKIFNEWLKAKDLESAKKLIDEYNQNWWDKIKKADTRKLIIKWMKDWLLEVNDSDKKYEIEDMLNDPSINIENKTIEWFSNSWGTPIEFPSYKELFNTVNLTNWIKKNFKWRPAINENPFHIDVIEWRIEFDDTEWYKIWKNETDVIKFRTLLKNDTLRNNREFYVNFLNKRWNVEGKTNIDLTKYPIVKWLSELWIQFTDETEARRTQLWLEHIQDEMKNRAIWPETWYKPYLIEGNKLVFIAIESSDWKMIKKYIMPDELPSHFVGENWTINDYPIIAHNKTKFLEYMNNKNNHMRGKNNR